MKYSILFLSISLLSCFSSCGHMNKPRITRIIKESFDSNFKANDISKIIKYDNRASRLSTGDRYNLDIIIRLNSSYDLNKLLNSHYHVGYGKLRDYYEVGLMSSLAISGVGRYEDVDIFMKLGENDRPLDNDLSTKPTPLDDFVIGVLYKESRELRIHKYHY